MRDEKTHDHRGIRKAEIKMVGGRYDGYLATFTPAWVLLTWFARNPEFNALDKSMNNMGSVDAIRLWYYIHDHHDQIYFEWLKDEATRHRYHLTPFQPRISQPVTFFEKIAHRISKTFS